MNQQPDKFFHEKLRGYQKPAPAGTWNRIAGNMQSKRRGPNWMRAAAAVALLAAAGILLYPRMKTDGSTSMIAENKTSERSTENRTRIPSDTMEDPAPTTSDAAREPVAVVPNDTPVKTKTSRPGKQVRRQPQITHDIQEPEIHAEQVIELSPTAESNVAVVSENPVDNNSDNNPKNVTIIFTSEEVNQKYLAKNSDAEATPESEETSGLKKLLDKAYDLKHNRDFLGELRQKKNEILAMNFKNEKRTQNN